MTHGFIGPSWLYDIFSSLVSGSRHVDFSELNACAIDPNIQSIWAPTRVLGNDKADLLDGMAKLTGACDLLVRQPTGSSSMLIGFSVVSRAVSSALRGLAIDDADRILILGGGYNAGATIASAVELSYDEIVIVSDPCGGPGSAVAAAHNMGVDVQFRRPEQVQIRDTDTIVDTDCAVAERIPMLPSSASVLRLYRHSLTAHNSFLFPQFLVGYLREVILLSSGIDLPFHIIQETVDNKIG
ncbi:hypothetical protein [Arcanobacterium phocae]|uniref:hypothetical protein n=1 Tax=Arcanobacterium phocae TaxID=131112 RepID=UPI001C0F0AB0|nr:hypothetical protein [Arcanobacterium phocae]